MTSLVSDLLPILIDKAGDNNTRIRCEILARLCMMHANIQIRCLYTLMPLHGVLTAHACGRRRVLMQTMLRVLLSCCVYLLCCCSFCHRAGSLSCRLLWLDLKPIMPCEKPQLARTSRTHV